MVTSAAAMIARKIVSSMERLPLTRIPMGTDQVQLRGSLRPMFGRGPRLAPTRSPEFAEQVRDHKRGGHISALGGDKGQGTAHCHRPPFCCPLQLPPD
jgi:hypothetical protein